jgi:hypothetical protein
MRSRTRNVTLAISDEAHHKARVWAAQHDVSLSAVLSELLENLPNSPNAEHAARRIRERSKPNLRVPRAPGPAAVSESSLAANQVL